jgi:hypothetical protein
MDNLSTNCEIALAEPPNGAFRWHDEDLAETEYKSAQEKETSDFVQAPIPRYPPRQLADFVECSALSAVRVVLTLPDDWSFTTELALKRQAPERLISLAEARERALRISRDTEERLSQERAEEARFLLESWEEEETEK